MLAAPILIGSCAPTQCTPAPPEAPPSTEPPPTTAPPAPPPPTAPPVAPQWSFLVTLPGGGYTRWDPCDDPITFEIDAPDSSQEVVIRDALATAAVATGFQFQEVASGGEAVIGLKDFPDGTLGEGGGNFNRTTGEMTSGVAYVDVGLKDLTLRYALLHEIGHMVGLGHVASAAEVMYTFAVSPPKQQYAGGDLEGLRLVGTTMPCFPTEALRVASPEQTVIVH